MLIYVPKAHRTLCLNKAVIIKTFLPSLLFIILIRPVSDWELFHAVNPTSRDSCLMEVIFNSNRVTTTPVHAGAGIMPSM
jgi:hypothetical protein